MKSYPSIETVYVRNPETHALELGKVRLDAAEAVHAWVITEKVDGMNIRAIFSYNNDTLYLDVRGRTDAAQLPPGVLEAVERAFPQDKRLNILSMWWKELTNGSTVTFYGEAFGEGIQKNPLRMAGKRFRVFDILVGPSVWLRDDEIRTLEDQIGFTAVPLLGLIHGLPETEKDLNELTKGGRSQVATEPVRPEGIVARPVVPLFDTWGDRVIWKLTYREFDKLRAIAAREEVAKVEASTPPVQAPMEGHDHDDMPPYPPQYQATSLEGSGALVYDGKSFSVTGQ